ncbi:hypothetical protein B0J13DRAFT_596814 [Dactylonectria estremocensis]|uniref:G domain-containing protein n=1 Tax=Dactylonectria estremocensis TaxID=1079267 RepID=A0A9P9EHV8_9HYPO|nr:hypothetical protein B0J13DRAFT_596814 [Dactylonectria estremocensis]
MPAHRRLPAPASIGLDLASSKARIPNIETDESGSDLEGPAMSLSETDSEVPVSSSSTQKPKGFRRGGIPKKSDVFIAVMGVTGSGKSSFISMCSDTRIKIGHSLEACTAVVDVYPCNLLTDRTVYLIDTPGFDDTDKSDNEVLGEIAAWLADSYQNKILLHGIIYLHRITDIRMQGSAKRNLLLFRELCGKDALQKVILATTMWDKVEREEGVRREAELRNTQEFWGWMVSQGSAVHRHQNTKESARKIINQLANHNKKFATDLQTQLVDQRLTLDETSAGKELQSELMKERERWEKQLRLVQKDMQAALEKNDQEAEKIMGEERDRYTRMIKKAEEKTATLRLTMESLIAQRDKRVARMEKKLKEQKEQKEQKEKKEKKGKKATREDAPKRVVGGRAEKGKPTGTEEFPPVSVSMFGSEFSLTSRICSMSNVPSPKRYSPKGSEVSATIIGEKTNDRKTWVARYSDETWGRSKFFERHYPHLDGQLRSNVKVKLASCALGADEQYSARWADGSWSCYAYDKTAGVMEDVVKICNKNADYGIKAIALGYKTTYIISYGSERKLRYKCELGAHYPALRQVLEAKNPLDIHAITLNPRSKTDFILVYSQPDGQHGISWICSNSIIDMEIRTWVNQTLGVDG